MVGLNKINFNKKIWTVVLFIVRQTFCVIPSFQFLFFLPLNTLDIR